MADWSIIVPGVVTPAVVAGFAFCQAAVARRQADLAEVRAVVDDAAQALTDLRHSVTPYRRRWERGEPPIDELRKAVDIARASVRYTNARIVVRVGRRSPLAVAHREARDAYDQLDDFLRAVVERGSQLPSELEQVSTLVIEAVDALERFLDAATTAVGTNLSLAPSPLYPALPLSRGDQ
jgi:hypothetical protein